jgi:hypothetical protein
MIREDDWLGEEVNKRVDGRRGASVQDLRGMRGQQSSSQQLSGTEEDDVCGFPTQPFDERGE